MTASIPWVRRAFVSSYLDVTATPLFATKYRSSSSSDLQLQLLLWHALLCSFSCMLPTQSKNSIQYVHRSCVCFNVHNIVDSVVVFQVNPFTHLLHVYTHIFAINNNYQLLNKRFGCQVLPSRYAPVRVLRPRPPSGLWPGPLWVLPRGTLVSSPWHLTPISVASCCSRSAYAHAAKWSMSVTDLDLPLV